jgi:hypothetical protein
VVIDDVILARPPVGPAPTRASVAPGLLVKPGLALPGLGATF